MKAMLLPAFGDSFIAGEIPTPTPGAGQVRIKVEASSVNPIDTKIRIGAVPAVSPALPGVLHGDVAGTIDAIGDGVTGFAIGDRVYGIAGGFKGTHGALAEYMVVNPAMIAHMPTSLDFAEAAAMPLVACTAWIALFNKAGLQAGDRLLVQGGTGGVGHIAVQLAALAGADVTATVSSDQKAEWALRMGANHAIRYDKWDDVKAEAQARGDLGFDLVFDTPGGIGLDRSIEACARNGTVVGIAGRNEHNLGLVHSMELTLKFAFLIGYFVDPSKRQQDIGDMLAKMAAFVDAGKLTPVIGESYPMSEVNEAHARLERGGFMGKIVLTQDLA
ncbi:zinc-binding dehydrogenase [Litorivicinus lipolyticus]|uniref:Zinc-binding dehydrogenase n=1 Tax=Litorivicinus lipolyticus TaxID=418701 RepID=A0A5Q2Q909_9GAMM|nr:zinc-binding dehydrogenase [Litorivicinus lipolyticus]QGG80688.1 zinc-binding dehydrogenase [Litorivicinus lipolyticus]